MSEHSDETLNKDLRDLAQTLLEHPEFGPLIRDAGTHRAFTDIEQDRIYTFCINAPVFSRYDERVGVQSSAMLSNLWLAVAIARRVAQGDFTSVDDSAAARMIDNQKILIDKAECEDEFINRKISYNDFLPLFLEFSKNRELDNLFQDFASIYNKYGQSNWDQKAIIDVLRPIHKHAAELMRRYGFTYSPVPMVTIWREIMINGRDPLNEDHIKSEARKYTSYINMES